MSLEYYSYGNVDLVYKMFNTVAQMTGANSSFPSLLTMSALLCLICLVGYGAFKGTLLPVGHWFFGAAIVWYGLFLPKTDVIIVDQTNPTANKVVSNMPIGLAAVGSISSSIGKWFTSKADAVFTANDDLSYAKTGMVFGANAYMTTRKLTLLTLSPEIQSDWSRFIENCTENDVAIYHKFTIPQLLNATDLLTFIGNTNQALPTTVDGTVMYCDQAYSLLKSKTEVLIKGAAFLNRVAKALNPNVTTDATMASIASAQMFTSFGKSYDKMFATTSSNALNIIQQQVLVNTFGIASLQNSQVMGSPEQMMAGVAAAQAEAQAANGWKTSALMATKYLPIMHNLIEGLCIALFPIVVVLMVIGGWAMWNVLLGYFSTFMWIGLWPGLFAIVNGIANSVNDYSTLAASNGAAGVTLGNAGNVLSVASQTQNMAGMMLMSVPIIAWFIVSMMKTGLSSLASAVLAPASSGAQSAGASVGSGNISVGNSSWNNTSANKNDQSRSHVSDRQYRSSNANGWVQGSFADSGGRLDSQGNVQGSTTGSTFAGTTKNDLPASASSKIEESRQATVSAERSQQQGDTWTSESTTSRTAANNSAVSWLMNQGDGVQTNSGSTSSLSAGNKRAYNAVSKLTDDLNTKYNVGNNQVTKANIGANVKAGMGLGGPSASAGVSGGVAGESATSYNKDLAAGLSAMKAQGISFDSNVGTEVANSTGFSKSLNAGNTLAKQTSTQLTDSIIASDRATKSYGDARTYREQASAARSAATTMTSRDTASESAAFAAYTKVGGTISGLSTPKGQAAYSQALATVMTEQPNTNAAGTRFDQSGAPDIKPMNGASERAKIHGDYDQSSNRVAGIAQNGQATIIGEASRAGLGGDVRSGIEADGQNMHNRTLGQVALNDQDIAKGEYAVNDGRAGIRSDMRTEVENMSLGQKIWSGEQSHKDVAEGMSNGAEDKTRFFDPKTTASTVVAGEPPKSSETTAPRSLRRLPSQWNSRRM